MVGTITNEGDLDGAIRDVLPRLDTYAPDDARLIEAVGQTRSALQTLLHATREQRLASQLDLTEQAGSLLETCNRVGLGTQG